MMKSQKVFRSSISLVALLFLVIGVYGQDADLSNLKGPYLGQKPPGKIPEVFAQGIISTNALEFGITISKDGNEIYFSRRLYRGDEPHIYGYKYQYGNWVSHKPPLFGWEGNESEPNLSPDETKIYFNSRRPLPNESIGRWRIWYAEKEGERWANPKVLLESGGMFATQSNNGAVYLTTFETGQSVSVFKNDGSVKSELLPDIINEYLNSGHPYIAPDESYIIYDFNTVLPKRNLLISYRVDGIWTEPVNLTKHLGITMENTALPFVTFDQKYFFFTSDGNIYWVDAGFIEELRPEN